MVASGHYLATQAGERILARGGNAIDAGVAAGLCLTVLHIDMVNLAGVAPIIVYLADEDRVLTISGLGRWPQAASVAYFKERCGGKIPPGVLRCITPGSPGRLDHRARAVRHDEPGRGHGGAHPPRRRGLPDASVHGRQRARGGGRFPEMAEQRGHPHARRTRARGGRDLRRRSDLARTMRRMLDAEAGARRQGREAGLRAARDLFYRGDIAREIAAFYQAEGGLLTYEDLAAFPVQVEEPVRASFHEYDVFTCGPWCQGPVLAQALTLLEGYDLAGLGHNSPAYVHLLTEALKLVFADRERYYGDPEFVDVPMRGAALAGVRRGAPAPDRPDARARRDAAGGRSVARQRRRRARGAASPPREPAAVRRRHDVRVRRRSARQHLLRHAERRLPERAGHAGHGPRRVVARLAVVGGRGPSELDRPRQAAAAHARARRSCSRTASRSCRSARRAATCSARPCCRCSSTSPCSAWPPQAAIEAAALLDLQLPGSFEPHDVPRRTSCASSGGSPPRSATRWPARGTRW